MSAGVDRLGNIRGLLDEAKSSLCIGWDSTERQMDPSKVLEALASVECAIRELDVLDRNLQQEDAEHSAANETRTAGDDPVALARSMQQRRHGAS